MKKIFLLILFITLKLAGYAQTVKGFVLDKQTRDTISFAAVYFSGTSSGTYTDKSGGFELDISKYSTMPLIASAIGYYSVTVSNYSTGKPVIIYLEPKVYQIGEVVVKDKSLARERRSNMDIFRREFLGRSDNAIMCKIVNEEDITFNYGSDRDTLKAYASKPIIIENEFLGYRVTYFLDRFEYYKRSYTFLFKGNIIFDDLPLENDDHYQAVKRRRKNTYLGSRMHFFRELWLNDLKSTGFTMSNSFSDILSYEDVVFQKSSQEKYLSYKGSINIKYYEKKESYIVFIKPQVFFEKNGFYDASGISWEGVMANQRVGDMLPYDYSPFY